MTLTQWHDDVIKWKHFPRCWPFVRGIHRSPVNSPHKCQWRGALMFSLICTRINGWVNNGETGDLRPYRAHYDVTVMDTRGCTMHYVMHKLIFNSLDIDFIHSDILIRSYKKYYFIIQILRVAYGGKITNGMWKVLYLSCWQNGGDIHVSVDYWFFVTDSINQASVRHDFMVPVAHFGSICTQRHPSFYHLDG